MTTILLQLRFNYMAIRFRFWRYASSIKRRWKRDWREKYEEFNKRSHFKDNKYSRTFNSDWWVCIDKVWSNVFFNSKTNFNCGTFNLYALSSKRICVALGFEHNGFSLIIIQLQHVDLESSTSNSLFVKNNHASLLQFRFVCYQHMNDAANKARRMMSDTCLVYKQ